MLPHPAQSFLRSYAPRAPVSNGECDNVASTTSGGIVREFSRNSCAGNENPRAALRFSGNDILSKLGGNHGAPSFTFIKEDGADGASYGLLDSRGGYFAGAFDNDDEAALGRVRHSSGATLAAARFVADVIACTALIWLGIGAVWLAWEIPQIVWTIGFGIVCSVPLFVWLGLAAALMTIAAGRVR